MDDPGEGGEETGLSGSGPANDEDVVTGMKRHANRGQGRVADADGERPAIRLHVDQVFDLHRAHVFGEDTHRGRCAGTDFDRLGGVGQPGAGHGDLDVSVGAGVDRPTGDEVVDAAHPEHRRPERVRLAEHEPVRHRRLHQGRQAPGPGGGEHRDQIPADALGDHPQEPVACRRAVGGVEGAQHRLEAVHHQHRHRVGVPATIEGGAPLVDRGQQHPDQAGHPVDLAR